MSMAVRLSDSLIEEAQKYAVVNFRTVPKQIEYWSQIGRIAEENPELSIDFIKQILLGLEEKAVPFTFREE